MEEKPIKIFCNNTDSNISVHGGDSLLQVSKSLKNIFKTPPICVKVNNKTESLNYRIFAPKKVEFLDRTNPSGRRTYVRSLCMILWKAVHELYPNNILRIEHSVSSGYFCILHNMTITPEIVSEIKAKMQEIVKANITYKRHERPTDEVIKLFNDSGLNDKSLLLSTTHELYSVYYTLGDTVDSFYGNLAPSTGYIDVFDLVTYGPGMLLLPFDRQNPSVPAKAIPQDKMMNIYKQSVEFNNILHFNNVGEMNKALDAQDSRMIINVAEALHEKQISRISDEVTRRFHEQGTRVVMIAGPSSSGKTTFSKRLSVQMVTNLLIPVTISLDNYFVNRANTPRDENGDYDYESLYALDLQQLNTDLQQLIAGKEVAMPTYNFATGEREYKGDTLKLNDNSILIMEGIHGLNPELTPAIPDSAKFKIYASALTTLSIDNHNWISTTDNRLLRRIIRDNKYRKVSAVDTIARWPSVRRGEDKWIFPYQENADAMFNSSLLFELSVLKIYAMPLLYGVPRDSPQYSEASRLISFLDVFTPIFEQQIPPTSLLREFLGGSSFKY